MPDVHHPRNSQIDARDADLRDASALQHQQNAHQAADRFRTELFAGYGDQIRSAQRRVDSYIDGGNEWLQDRGHDFDNWRNNTARGLQRDADQAERAAQHGLDQAGHIIPDAYVRARRELRQASTQLDQAADRRERELYPENHNRNADPTRTLAWRTPHPEAPRPAQPHDTTPHAPQAPHGAAAREATTQADHPRTADSTTHPRTADSTTHHDPYVVRRGDNLSSIVRRDEERRHPGVHNARQEHLRVRALTDRYGETILPDMHIDLTT